MYIMLNVISTLFLITTHATNSSNPSSDLFPHDQFECDPLSDAYETEFIFLQGSGHGFVHAESNRVFFEYYFPIQHWVAFATADQSIQGAQYYCSKCYFENYYPSSPTNNSNLYPNCIEECLNDALFVGSVNADEQNINSWAMIDFQITSQNSQSLQKKMYRIPPSDKILEVWGNTDSAYRKDAHFDINITQINFGLNRQEWKQFVHARFWRDYDFESNQNEWKPFVNGPDMDSNTSDSDSFCFISVGSFSGGAYPYDDDALNRRLPGFYIDAEHFANIHCYKTNDIKVDCSGKTLTDSSDSIEELDYFYSDDTDMYTDTDIINKEPDFDVYQYLSEYLSEYFGITDNVEDYDMHFDTDNEDTESSAAVIIDEVDFYYHTTTTKANVKDVRFDNPDDDAMASMTHEQSEDYEQIEDSDDTDSAADIIDELDDSFMQDNDVTVINFCVEWCLRCHRFYSEWNDLERKGNAMTFIDHSGNEVITKFQLVDCSLNPNICHRFEIRAYPAIRIYNNNVRTHANYTGERKANGLLEYVKTFIANDSLFTTTDANVNDIRVDNPYYDIQSEDPPRPGKYEYALAAVLLIAIIFCVCFLCMNKSRQRSMNMLPRVEYDEFNEGFVENNISTLVVISQQT